MTDFSTQHHVVSIELKRVQSFIFAVPRLKAMIGANAMIGEMMRSVLPQLASKHGAETLQDYGAPSADPHDPLMDDNPVELYKRGILVRDGGHFKAVFPDDDRAKAFQAAAAALLIERLPDMLFDIQCRRLDDDPKTVGMRPAAVEEVQLIDLSVLQICQETGQEVASRQFVEHGRLRMIAASVVEKRLAGRRFSQGKTDDLIGRMRGNLGLNAQGWAGERNWETPRDLKDLCSGGYLALVHADGNNVGASYRKRMEGAPAGDPIAREAFGERFYHSSRVAVRKSLVAALRNTFTDSDGKRPYEVLMLGGDDLLVACRADKALAFVYNYAEELKEHTLADGNALTIGAGVAIAKQSYPIHRLHKLAEALASSAKRLFRALPENGKCSVVDWQIVTQSWFDDLATTRRQADLKQYRVDGKDETLILSQRPYPILPVNGRDSLADLLVSVHKLAPARTRDSNGENPASRSSLRSLRSSFEQGRLAGEMAFDGLEEEVRESLASGNNKSPWSDKGEGRHLTRALDVVDLYEISRLGIKHHD